MDIVYQEFCLENIRFQIFEPVSGLHESLDVFQRCCPPKLRVRRSRRFPTSSQNEDCRQPREGHELSSDMVTFKNR
jgi:hypothetical protein